MGSKIGGIVLVLGAALAGGSAGGAVPGGVAATLVGVILVLVGAVTLASSK